MEELKKVLASLLSEKLYQIIISNPRQKAGAFKIKVRPVMVKEQVVFQQTVYEGTKVFHDNLDRQTASSKILTEAALRIFEERHSFIAPISNRIFPFS